MDWKDYPLKAFTIENYEFSKNIIEDLMFLLKVAFKKDEFVFDQQLLSELLEMKIVIEAEKSDENQQGRAKRSFC